MKPAKPVFMQNERRISGNRVEPVFVSARLIIRWLLQREIRLISAGPFPLSDVPPDKFLFLTPRPAIRRRARSIINDAAIARPGEAPTVTEITLRIARVGFVD